jgi:signal transduction histidine kinase
MNALPASLEDLVLERLSDGRFLAQGATPAWCHDLRPGIDWQSPVAIQDVFPFLSVFLPVAERSWESVPPARADSDLWTESPDGGAGDVHLFASAVRVRGASALIVLRDDPLFLDRQNLLQRGRELRLLNSTLMKEREQKDILVHGIVHDLMSPLHAIIGLLSLLSESVEREPEADWLRVAIAAARRQQELIAEIRDVFTAEVAALNQVPSDGVELMDVLHRVLEERESVARGSAVRIELDATLERACVVGEEMRLFRVLTNLLDNALRYSPSGGVVRLAVRGDDSGVTICVEDEGPGIAPEVLPRLFEKFARGLDRGSGTGLGLFFCRMTVENWGGAIGCERRDDGRGSRFWIRLRSRPPPIGDGRRTG